MKNRKIKEGTERVLRQVRERIDQHGWTVIGVFADHEATPPAPSFAYTVGLTENYKHPELVIVGLPPETAQGILAGACERIKAGDLTCADGGSDDRLLQGYNAAFRTVDPERIGKYLRMARVMEGDAVGAVQIVWPDAHGRYPWQADADTGFASYQPLLFNAIH